MKTEYLTKKEVQAEYRFGRKELDALMRCRLIPYENRSKYKMFRRNDIESYLEQIRIKAVA